MSPTTTTPALPAPLSTLAAQAANADDANDANDTPERRAHPLVAVGLGLVAGLLLARWIRR